MQKKKEKKGPPIEGQALTDSAPTPTTATTAADRPIRTRLLVAADEGNSAIRQQAGLEMAGFEYGQTALTLSGKTARAAPTRTAHGAAAAVVSKRKTGLSAISPNGAARAAPYVVRPSLRRCLEYYTGRSVATEIHV